MIDSKQIEMAVGGKYSMPDGRQFWVDAPVAREITSRVVAALDAAQSDRKEWALRLIEWLGMDGYHLWTKSLPAEILATFDAQEKAREASHDNDE
jgi:hypothetical protein